MLERSLSLSRRTPLAIPDDHAVAERVAERIGRLAIRSLYREPVLAPKPGLVSPTSQGSHRDMNFSTFVRSLQSLRSYFPAPLAQNLLLYAYPFSLVIYNVGLCRTA